MGKAKLEETKERLEYACKLLRICRDFVRTQAGGEYADYVSEEDIDALLEKLEQSGLIDE